MRQDGLSSKFDPVEPTDIVASRLGRCCERSGGMNGKAGCRVVDHGESRPPVRGGMAFEDTIVYHGNDGDPAVQQGGTQVVGNEDHVGQKGPDGSPKLPL